MNNQVKKFPEEFLSDGYSVTESVYISQKQEVQEEENPNGEVRTYFLPEAFEWVKEKIPGIRKSITYPWVAMRRKGFIVGEYAAQKFKLKPGDRIKFGVNKKYIVIVKDEESEISVHSNATWNTKKLKEKKKEYISLRTGSVANLKKVLEKNGWPEAFKVEVDLQNGMLVGKNPEPGENETVENIQTGQGQASTHPWRAKPMSKEEFKAKVLANKNGRNKNANNERSI